MRVLVTGAAGSIGQVLTVGLTDRGHDVVGFDRVPAPDGTDIPWHTGDCADAASGGRLPRWPAGRCPASG